MTEIDWDARHKRAREYTKQLKAEWEEAARLKRPARYIAYDYRDEEDDPATPPPPPARPKEEGA